MTVEQCGWLLAIATIVSMVCRKLTIPYTVGLTLAGFGLAFVPTAMNVSLTKELVYSAFLPPLIFEGARQIRWTELRRDAAPILFLAAPGLLLSAAVVAVGAHFAIGLPWVSSALFGILISATDPVAVIASFKEARADDRVKLLVEAESLFNDGTAAVLFMVSLQTLAGNQPSFGAISGTFVMTVLGGLVIGAAIGGLAIGLAGRTDDHLIETTFTMIAAYGSFLVAEHFHVSGVLATLTTGLMLGNLGSLGSFSDRGHETVESFWEFVAFVANSLIFLLMGLRLAHRPLIAAAPNILEAVAFVTLGRAATVYLGSAVFSRTSWRIPVAQQHILVWGGLRGALALALVLGLPPDLPNREALIDLTFGVVAFSVIVQGTTIGPVVRRLTPQT